MKSRKLREYLSWLNFLCFFMLLNFKAFFIWSFRFWFKFELCSLAFLLLLLFVVPLLLTFIIWISFLIVDFFDWKNDISFIIILDLLFMLKYVFLFLFLLIFFCFFPAEIFFLRKLFNELSIPDLFFLLLWELSFWKISVLKRYKFVLLFDLFLFVFKEIWFIFKLEFGFICNLDSNNFLLFSLKISLLDIYYFF